MSRDADQTKPNVQKEIMGLHRITKKGLRDLCKKNKLYQTPQLNDVLYLHYQGFQCIECLEEYSELKCLWLECNAISEIGGLACQTKLKCLFLQSNLIKRIENLDACTELDTLNLASNHIRKIENCGSSILPHLNTLNLSTNYLKDFDGLRELENCLALSVLDLSNNRIDDILIVKIFAKMPQLRVLVLQGNPVVSKIPQYRKTLTLECKELTYLDSRPVFPKDRACAEAWKRGGYDEERKEQNRWARKDRKKLRDSVNATIRMRNKYKDATGQLALLTSSDSEPEAVNDRPQKIKPDTANERSVRDEDLSEVSSDQNNSLPSSTTDSSPSKSISSSSTGNTDEELKNNTNIEEKICKISMDVFKFGEVLDKTNPLDKKELGPSEQQEITKIETLSNTDSDDDKMEELNATSVAIRKASSNDFGSDNVPSPKRVKLQIELADANETYEPEREMQRLIDGMSDKNERFIKNKDDEIVIKIAKTKEQIEHEQECEQVNKKVQKDFEELSSNMDNFMDEMLKDQEERRSEAERLGIAKSESNDSSQTDLDGFDDVIVSPTLSTKLREVIVQNQKDGNEDIVVIYKYKPDESLNKHSINTENNAKQIVTGLDPTAESKVTENYNFGSPTLEKREIVITELLNDLEEAEFLTAADENEDPQSQKQLKEEVNLDVSSDVYLDVSSDVYLDVSSDVNLDVSSDVNLDVSSNVNLYVPSDDEEMQFSKKTEESFENDMNKLQSKFDAFEHEVQDLQVLLQQLEDENERLYKVDLDFIKSTTDDLTEVVHEVIEAENCKKLCLDILDDLLKNLELNEQIPFKPKSYKFVDLESDEEYSYSDVPMPPLPEIKPLRYVLDGFNDFLQEIKRQNSERLERKKAEHQRFITTDQEKRKCLQDLLQSPKLHELTKDTEESLDEQLNAMMDRKKEHVKKMVERVYAQKDKYEDTVDVVDGKLVVVKKDTGQIESLPLPRANYSDSEDDYDTAESEDEYDNDGAGSNQQSHGACMSTSGTLGKMLDNIDEAEEQFHSFDSQRPQLFTEIDREFFNKLDLNNIKPNEDDEPNIIECSKSYEELKEMMKKNEEPTKTLTAEENILFMEMLENSKPQDFAIIQNMDDNPLFAEENLLLQKLMQRTKEKDLEDNNVNLNATEAYTIDRMKISEKEKNKPIVLEKAVQLYEYFGSSQTTEEYNKKIITTASSTKTENSQDQYKKSKELEAEIFNVENDWGEFQDPIELGSDTCDIVKNDEIEVGEMNQTLPAVNSEFLLLEKAGADDDNTIEQLTATKASRGEHVSITIWEGEDYNNVIGTKILPMNLYNENDKFYTIKKLTDTESSGAEHESIAAREAADNNNTFANKTATKIEPELEGLNNGNDNFNIKKQFTETETSGAEQEYLAIGDGKNNNDILKNETATNKIEPELEALNSGSDNYKTKEQLTDTKIGGAKHESNAAQDASDNNNDNVTYKIAAKIETEPEDLNTGNNVPEKPHTAADVIEFKLEVIGDNDETVDEIIVNADFVYNV